MLLEPERKNLLELLLCPQCPRQRHGPAGRGSSMALKDEQNPKYAFPEAGTSLLKSPTKSLLYVSHSHFSMLATGSLLAAALPPLLLLLLMLLEP